MLDIEATHFSPNQVTAIFRLWQEEREKYGLPKDFSDITWPPELRLDGQTG